MNCLSHVSSYYKAILAKTSRFIAKSSLYGCSTSSWKRNLEHAMVKTNNLEFMFMRISVQSYSSRRIRGTKSQSQKLDSKPVTEEEKDEYFVVRKGDVIGVYKSFSDCQAQVGSSIWDPPVSIYKGSSLPKDTEEYLVSRGLKNATYTIRAADLKEDLFGTLVPCPSQEVVESTSIGTDPLREHIKLDHVEAQTLSSDCRACVIEFDGASKGNPGRAGAGAVLRAESGRVICRLREGLGSATNNAAEYQAMILGLKYALNKGYTSIRVQGDSKLVCMQLLGLWKVRNKNMSIFYEEAKKLMDKFFSVEINHVLREFNSEADAEANLAVKLAVGQVQELHEL